MNEDKKIIVVLGMHRSGTSAVSRALLALGVDLGGNLMQAIPGNNEKGFWEDNDIYQFNEELLGFIHSRWDGLELFDSSFLSRPHLEIKKIEAAKLLKEKITAPLFGFKDPRTSILLPFWQDIFKTLSLSDHYVIALRNPVNVVQSLTNRDEFAQEKSYLLWAKHLFSALRYTAGKPRIIVDFDSLLAEPQTQLLRIAEGLGLDQGSKESMQEFQDSFLDRGLCHNKSTIDDLRNDTSCLPFIKEAYFLLLEVAQDTARLDDPEFMEKFSRCESEFLKLAPLLTYIDQLDALCEKYGKSSLDHEAMIETCTALQNERDDAVSYMESVVLERNEAYLRLGRALADRDTAIFSVNRSKDELQKIMVERDGLVENVASLQGHYDYVEARLKTVQKSIKLLTAKHQCTLVKIDQLRASKSWKITKPLRVMTKVYTQPKAIARRVLSEAARTIWDKLPFTVHHKIALKRFLFSKFSFFLKHSQTYKAWEVHGCSPKSCPKEYVPIPVQEVKPVPLLDADSLDDLPVKLIAFYLPQFHTIAENDEWWGEGFTEWTNVKRATAQFTGHYQPHEPGDLGYYDLSTVETQRRQVELAKLYGVGGFCFYFYWFAGKRLLETPVLNYLNDTSLDLPFCLCWANENWSRRWDGLDNEILIGQNYSPDDDIAFISYISQYLKDHRYIRIQGKPLLLVYRPSLLPSAKETAERWRTWCRDNGVGEIYLAYTQSFDGGDPEDIGFDAAIEFPPNNSQPPLITDHIVDAGKSDFKGQVYDWRELAQRSESYKETAYKLFRGVCPSWDNTARRMENGTIFLGSTPEKYAMWLENASRDTIERFDDPSERLVFVNAWNEWAEGAHLEPDARFGYAYLQQTRNALERVQADLGGKRIVLVSHDALTHGAQVLILHIAKFLYEDFGFTIDMVVLGDGPFLSEFAKYATVHQFYEEEDIDGKCATILASQLFEKGGRAAIANTTVSGSFAAILKEQGFRVVSLIHELPGVLKQRGLKAKVKAIAKNVDHIVFPAQQVYDGFSSFAPGGKNAIAEQAVILPQGLFRRNSFRGAKGRQEARRLLREKFTLPATAKIVLGIGYGDERKGTDLFVQIGSRLMKDDPDVYFLWVGHFDSAMDRKVKKLVDASGFGSRFIFPGLDFEADLYYAGSDVYALTSREDPFPCVVLEALGSSLPIVAFAGTGGFCDLLERGCGKLSPAFDVESFAQITADLLGSEEGRALGEVGEGIVVGEFSFHHYLFDLLKLLRLPVKRVSVIVPNYNYARYMVERIESITRQTYPIYELIVLDDASTDESVSVLENLLPSLEIPYRFICNDDNSGNPFIQWKKGVEAARGDYIWIAEADDLAQVDFLETVLQPFGHDEQIVMSYCQSKQMDTDGEVFCEDYLEYVSDISTSKWKSAYVEEGLNEIQNALTVKNTIPNVSGVVFKRQQLLDVLAAEIDDIQQYRVAGDWHTYVSVLKNGGRIAYSPASRNLHRRHNESITISGFNYEQLNEILQVQEYASQCSAPSSDVRANAKRYSGTLYKQLQEATTPPDDLTHLPYLASFMDQSL